MKALRAGLAFVGLLPWVRGFAQSDLNASVTRAIDLAFVALCHHAPLRTLMLRGAPMCVCSRCAGTYAGVFLAAAFPWGVGAAKLRFALPAGALLMMADILSQDLGLHPPWHAVRLTTGALIGWAATAWMLSEISESRRSDAQGAAGAT